jgi:hypothetical protein
MGEMTEQTLATVLVLGSLLQSAGFRRLLVEVE